MNSENIGKFLLEQRKKNELTQKDISMLCNISTQAVSKWERGDSVPDIEQLEKLSVLYKVSINEIINGEKKQLYMDLEKRENIILLTSSILVFISYIFTFLKLDIIDPFSLELTLLLKGYEVIFDGYDGYIVYTCWIVFLILVLQLIIRIFQMTKVVATTKKITTFYHFSSLIVIVLGLIGLVVGYYVAFPQFIIILVSGMIFYFNRRTYSFVKVTESLKEIKEFHKVKKQNKVPSDLMFNKTEIRRPMILYRISVTYSIILYLLIVGVLSLYLIYGTINNVPYDGTPKEAVILYIVTNMIPLLGLIYTRKYSKSIYMYFGIGLNILFSLFPLVNHIFNGMSLDNPQYNIWLMIYIIPTLLFGYLLFKFHKLKNQNTSK